MNIKSLKSEEQGLRQVFVMKKIAALQQHLEQVEQWLIKNAGNSEWLQAANHRSKVLADLHTYRCIEDNIRANRPTHGYGESGVDTSKRNGFFLNNGHILTNKK